jgi:hypothetical protein
MYQESAPAGRLRSGKSPARRHGADIGSAMMTAWGQLPASGEDTEGLRADALARAAIDAARR